MQLVTQRVLFKRLKKKGVKPRKNSNNHWKCQLDDKTVNLSDRKEYPQHLGSVLIILCHKVPALGTSDLIL